MRVLLRIIRIPNPRKYDGAHPVDRNCRMAKMASTKNREHGVGRPWNNTPVKFLERTFYRPIKGMAGSGVQDFYKKYYQIQADGSLRRVTPRRHEINKSL